MAKQSKIVVMAGRTPVQGVLTVLQASAEIREATTGRAVTLPRVWAVAAPLLVREASTESNAQSRVKLKKQVTQERSVPREELAFYRKYTERLLERYVQMSMEAGRVSSMMGHEVIGGKASSYRIHGFDDAVIFRLDVEKCLVQLSPGDREGCEPVWAGFGPAYRYPAAKSVVGSGKGLSGSLACEEAMRLGIYA